jgi:hypothetical protein
MKPRGPRGRERKSLKAAEHFPPLVRERAPLVEG